MVMVETEFAGQDVRTLLARHAQERGNHPFLVWEPFDGVQVDGMRSHWTYAAFLAQVKVVAAGLVARGVAPGDHVLIHLENCPEFLMAWLACGWVGAVAVTTNTRSTVSDIAYFARHCQAVGAITEPAYQAAVRAGLADGAWLHVVRAGQGMGDLAGDPTALPALEARPDRPFAIQYTSGTTARPKAVLWSHGNCLWGAQVSAMHEGLRPDDVHLVFLPLIHTNAQVYSVLASLWVGATVVLQPRFSASRFWEVALRNGCTWTSVVPFCTSALLEHPVPARHSFRFFGAAIRIPALEAHFRVPMVTWWGMTETISHGIVSSPTRPAAPMGMGFSSPYYEILVLDDGMQPVSPGETGDLYVRGQRGLSLFMEYAGDADATAKSFTPDGLFITGDRVRLGEDGTLFFVERAKDMLKVGGENVAASEIERVIMMVPGVREVAVAGRLHPMLDEVPVAFVIPHNGTDVAGLTADIVATCEEQLADYKRPHEVRLVDDLPRSTLNKVSKADLRCMLQG
ncbi:AMP-binding protein [Niveispirillum sp.]|uniref:AMP-binding protein n=1 Tax=Niveispirillum sp. TaxID=1917217 RepID=UPI001B7748D6|nr:AMP-binding protein [Niveispirillum sp.]MBP7338614.1 AMP-binding protein [Niveispirillum sp.]